MRQQILIVFGLMGILSIAACHKAVPVASRPTPPTPVVAAAPAPAPRATPRPAPVSVAPSRITQTTRPATMTPKERATLNDSLARLEDALFDYDKATMMCWARAVLSPSPQDI